MWFFYRFMSVMGIFSLGLISTANAGNLEPSGPPGPTMHSIEDVYNLIVETNTLKETPPARVAATGAISRVDGDDGALQTGVAFPDPRFEDNFDGTVTDKLTGLVWLKDASALGMKNWTDALAACAQMKSGDPGLVLSDGSVETEWRLPNIKELRSLIHYGKTFSSKPALVEGHPFINVQLEEYFSSTSRAGTVGGGNKWLVDLDSGMSRTQSQSAEKYVWPVRDAR